MTTRSISEAKEQLSALLVMVERGEEIIITRSGRPVARLIPYEGRTERRKLGALRGQFAISADFDSWDPDTEHLFYEAPVDPAP